jgi:hypothetical protein
LTAHPNAPVKVYAVWLPVLWTDSREHWNGNSMPDPRVLHFWDGEMVVGQWFAEHVEGFEGIVWDAFYVFGPEATWQEIPAPRAASGGTIYGQRDLLAAQLYSVIGD